MFRAKLWGCLGAAQGLASSCVGAGVAPALLLARFFAVK